MPRTCPCGLPQPCDDACCGRFHRADVLHENSRFAREGGRWTYVGPV